LRSLDSVEGNLDSVVEGILGFVEGNLDSVEGSFDFVVGGSLGSVEGILDYWGSLGFVEGILDFVVVVVEGSFDFDLRRLQRQEAIPCFYKSCNQSSSHSLFLYGFQYFHGLFLYHCICDI